MIPVFQFHATLKQIDLKHGRIGFQSVKFKYKSKLNFFHLFQVNIDQLINYLSLPKLKK